MAGPSLPPLLPPAGRAFHAADPRQARGRLFIGLATGAAAALLLPADLGWAVRAVAGWDTGAFVMLLLSWHIIWNADQVETRCRAATSDPGRTVAWLLVLLSSAFSLFAAEGVLRKAHALSPHAAGLLAALCLIAVANSWTLTHSAYTLRYAHLYYRDDDGVGGLGFPGEDPPDAFDFAYFAFTIGMCFQVSDVTITSRAFRRTVLGHSLLSFAYNTAILALALNLIFGLLG